VVTLDGHGNKNATSYDWYYSYDGKQPHAPTHIGERTFEYDLNGNQRGWTHDRNATWRKITWDDENRIQVIEDKGRTSTYGYDDQGQRVIKQSRQNLTVYANQFFTERNGSIGSKHIFVGNTRILTKVTGGTNFIRSYDGYYGSKTPPGQVKGGGKESPGKGKEPGKGKGQDKDRTNQGKHLGQEKNADKGNSGKSQGKGQDKAAGNEKAKGPTKEGFHPGQGIFNRSERASEVAQNVCKNKHLRGIYCNDDGELIVDPGDGIDFGDGWNEDGWLNEGYDYDYSFLPEREIIKISMGEQLFYYHSDHLGSTGYVTRGNGVIHEHIQYFPFGETWVQQGGNTEKSPYLFTSKELDEETGLYYFGARYYDPRTSVWASVDPILGQYLDGEPNGGIYIPATLSLYAYGAQNPVRFKDDNGEFVNFLIGAGIGAVLDIGVQAVLISTGQQDTFNLSNVAASAAAGAVGVGVATKTAQIGKLGVKLLAEVGGDTAVSIGSKAAKGEEITATGVIVDVAAGQAGGKAVGKIFKDKAAGSAEAKILDKAADRADRIANNPKVGRPEARARQAESARGAKEGFLNEAEIRGGTIGSNFGQKAAEVLSPPKQQENQQ
jgi:RHS repeat-associated protein